MNDKNKSSKIKKPQDNKEKKARHDHPVINMTVHVVVATLCFLLVATAAYGIDVYVQWMHYNGASACLASLLEGFARALATLDVACALRYIIKNIFDESFDDFDE